MDKNKTQDNPGHSGTLQQTQTQTINLIVINSYFLFFNKLVEGHVPFPPWLFLTISWESWRGRYYDLYGEIRAQRN